MCNNEHGCLSNGPDGSLPAACVTYDRVFHEPRNAIVTRVMMRGNVRLFYDISQLARSQKLPNDAMLKYIPHSTNLAN